ncbi:MAG: hypothetical protein IJ054_01845 [Lachnospiraceae bacterium]|nr:hypothetical protein [Lachnospiraceae bacterium]MBQ9609945.1 hypothetical protein [Lachnospiraceae bacterium]
MASATIGSDSKLLTVAACVFLMHHRKPGAVPTHEKREANLYMDALIACYPYAN